MARTGAELIDEVQALCGRSTDTVLITPARITPWLNEAQRQIIDNVAGIKCLTFKNAKSIACVSDQMKYAISDITTGGDNTTQKACHIFNIYFLDGANSYKLTYFPTDEFDAMYPDPTSSDFEPDKPMRWTERAGNIEVFPRPSTEYADYTLAIDCDFYAADFSVDSTKTSDITNSDDGLIYYALSRAFTAIGGQEGSAKSIENKTYFAEWLSDYQGDNDNLSGWEATLYPED